MLTIYLLVPTIYLYTGNFPERAFYKEIISAVVVGALVLTLAQFYLSRINKKLQNQTKMVYIIRSHKFIGYIISFILLAHPFMVVIPKFFDSGITPVDAFKNMITTYSSKGVIFGIIAWIFLLILTITSLFRNQLPIKHTTWRVFHGVTALVFVVFSTFHAVNLGKHTDINLSLYMIILAAIGFILLIKLYLTTKKKGLKNEQ